MANTAADTAVTILWFGDIFLQVGWGGSIAVTMNCATKKYSEKTSAFHEPGKYAGLEIGDRTGARDHKRGTGGSPVAGSANVLVGM